MHRRTPSETQRLRHLAAESAHAAPCHGDGASGAHLRSLRSSFALHVVRHVLWTASRSKSSTQQHRTSSPWPLIRRSYTTPGHSLHRDTDCTVTCAKMATDNSLRGRRFRDTVPGPPPTQPTGWAGGGPAWVYRTDGAGPRPAAPFPSPTPGLPGSAFVPALTLIMRRQTHKGIAHKGIFLGSRIVDTPAKNHRKSVVGGGPAAGDRR